MKPHFAADIFEHSTLQRPRTAKASSASEARSIIIAAQWKLSATLIYYVPTIPAIFTRMLKPKLVPVSEVLTHLKHKKKQIQLAL